MKITVFLTALICFLLKETGRSQEADFYMGLQKFSFIDYQKNKINIPDSDTFFKDFFLRFDSVVAFGTGKIHILHIGGSHIQADIYTNLVRQRLEDLSYDTKGGRGLVFPYRIAQTNNPENYSVTYSGKWSYSKNTLPGNYENLGITGMAVITDDDRSSITIDINKESDRYTYNEVRVFHKPCSYSLNSFYNGKLLAGQYDSTGNFTWFEYHNTSQKFTLEILKGDIDESFILTGIEFLNDVPGITYSTAGVNGATVESYLKCEQFGEQLKVINPDLVIISLGTNDGYTLKFDEEKYYGNYRKLLSLIHNIVPGKAILLTVPNDSYLYKRHINQNTEKMRLLIGSLAHEFQCGTWDFYTVMGGLNSSETWHSQKLMQNDRVHFNKKGYELKGDLFFSAFLRAWELHMITEPIIQKEKTFAGQ